jgi:hypothetical protein
LAVKDTVPENEYDYVSIHKNEEEGLALFEDIDYRQSDEKKPKYAFQFEEEPERRMNIEGKRAREDSFKEVVDSQQLYARPDQKKETGNGGNESDSSGRQGEFLPPSFLTGPNYKSLRQLVPSLQVADQRDTSINSEDQMWVGQRPTSGLEGDRASRDPLERFLQMKERREGNAGKSTCSLGPLNWSKEAINQGFSSHGSRELKSEFSQLGLVESKPSGEQTNPESKKGYLNTILGKDISSNFFIDFPDWESRDEHSRKEQKNVSLDLPNEVKNTMDSPAYALDAGQASDPAQQRLERSVRSYDYQNRLPVLKKASQNERDSSHSASDPNSFMDQSSSKDLIEVLVSQPTPCVEKTPLSRKSEGVLRRKAKSKNLEQMLRDSSLGKKFGNILSSLKTIELATQGSRSSANEKLKNLKGKEMSSRDLISQRKDTMKTKALPEMNFKKKSNNQVSIRIGQILNLTVTPKNYFIKSRSISKGATTDQVRLKTEEENLNKEESRLRKDSPSRSKVPGSTSKERTREHRDPTGMSSIMRILNNSLRQTTSNAETIQGHEMPAGNQASRFIQKIFQKGNRTNSKESLRSINSSRGQLKPDLWPQNAAQANNSCYKMAGPTENSRSFPKRPEIESLIGKMYKETASKWSISNQDLIRTQDDKDGRENRNRLREKSKESDSSIDLKQASYQSFGNLNIKLNRAWTPSRHLGRSQENSKSITRRLEQLPEKKYDNFSTARYAEKSSGQRSGYEMKNLTKDIKGQATDQVGKDNTGNKSWRENKSELEKVNSRLKALRSEHQKPTISEFAETQRNYDAKVPPYRKHNPTKTEVVTMPPHVVRHRESKGQQQDKRNYDALGVRDNKLQNASNLLLAHRNEPTNCGSPPNAKEPPQNILQGHKISAESNTEKGVSDQKGAFYNLLRGLQSTADAKPVAYVGSRK